MRTLERSSISRAVSPAFGLSSSRVSIRTSAWTRIGSSEVQAASQSAQPFCAGRPPCAPRLAQQATSTVPVRSSRTRKAKRVPFSLFVRSRARGDDADDGDLVAGPLRRDPPRRWPRRSASDLLLVAPERVAGDVEAERVLLEAEPDPLRPLLHRRLADEVARRSGSGASPPSAGSAPKRLDWPLARSACALAPAAKAASMPSKSCQRGVPSKSNAPLFTSASQTFLLIRRESTRDAKSKRLLNGPPSPRAWRIASTAASPTPFTAPRPKRILPFIAEGDPPSPHRGRGSG